MAKQEKVELMQHYPTPQTPAEKSESTFWAWVLFGILTIITVMGAVYFNG
ncbi:hypothetical protein [Calderihabitans maritimus]|uniref:Uncharacterized protein n=1 Tax=Calderihabitans maritimus TaxID=1246530 RepID=A0A1Z5HWI3_9FIRM|nr:hypothetical protein [Calderihabitans maritimus]GAW93691.1 hypothetical protein KKC1_28190 [Calderihabitans maritimus]